MAVKNEDGLNVITKDNQLVLTDSCFCQAISSTENSVQTVTTAEYFNSIPLSHRKM